MVTHKYCAFPYCRSDSRYFHKPHMKGVKFIAFPKFKSKPLLCKQWVNWLSKFKPGFSVNSVKYYSYICSNHLEDEFFQTQKWLKKPENQIPPLTILKPAVSILKSTVSTPVTTISTPVTTISTPVTTMSTPVTTISTPMAAALMANSPEKRLSSSTVTMESTSMECTPISDMLSPDSTCKTILEGPASLSKTSVLIPRSSLGFCKSQISAELHSEKSPPAKPSLLDHDYVKPATNSSGEKSDKINTKSPESTNQAMEEDIGESVDGESDEKNTKASEYKNQIMEEDIGKLADDRTMIIYWPFGPSLSNEKIRDFFRSYSFPKDWAVSEIEEGLRLSKINNNTGGVLISVTISLELDLSLRILNETFQDYSLLPELQKKLSHHKDFTKFLNKLSSLQVCQGNQEELYQKINKEKSVPNGKLCWITNAIRHSSCCLLSQMKRCRNCVKLRSFFRGEVFRRKKDKQKISSFKSLSQSELIYELKKSKCKEVNLTKKLNRSEKKISKLIMKSGDSVSPKGVEWLEDVLAKGVDEEVDFPKLFLGT